MVRLLLRAYIKRFLSIFLSLIFIGSLSAGLFNAFLSAKDHLQNDPIRFFNAYGYVDEYISIPLDERSEYMGLYEIEGVESIDMRLSLDVHLQKDDGRIINARILTYSGEENEIMKHHIAESTARDESKYNVAVSSKFAANNHFVLGQDIALSMYGYEQNAFISEIVDTVEGVFPSFNPYVWTDDYDFGYIYFLESDLNRIIEEFAPFLDGLPDLQTRVQEFTNLDSFDPTSLGDHYASTVTNEIIIKNKPGFSENDVTSRVNQYFDDHNIKPLFVLKGDDTPSRQYMKSVNNQLGVAFIFLPVFFYAIVTILVGLFIAQIIRQTTRNIGIMLSNGASRAEIIRILLSFAALISLIAGLLAIPIGYGVSTLVASAMVKTYCIPLIGSSLSLPIIFLGIASLVAVSVLAASLASLRIFAITPKDAALNNEARRKVLPPKIEKAVAKMPFTPQSATNSMLQNKRRFFISTFAIAASLLMTLLCGSFYLSKTALIDQGCNERMNYDCQVYFQQEADPMLIDFIKQEGRVTKLLDCRYSYLEVNSPSGKSKYLECLAFDPSQNDGMVRIPDEYGRGFLTLPEDGIVLPKGYAGELSLAKGDTLTINGHEIQVVGISYQYYHPITYLSKAQLESIGADCYSSLLINTKDEQKLSEVLNQNTARSLIVFTSSLKMDLHRIFDTLDIFLWIMTVFALAIALTILFTMSQSALAEQIHQFSLYRAVGFRIGAISKIFLFQDGVELLFGTICAIPLNVLGSRILFTLASSPRQTYPFVFSFPLIGIALVFVIAVIGIVHLLSLRKIKHIDIADNLRASE